MISLPQMSRLVVEPIQRYGLVTLLLISSTIYAQQPPLRSDSATATSLLEAGEPAEARDAFEQLLKAIPNDHAAQDGEIAASERLALDKRSAGDKDGALRDLLRARDFALRSGRLLYDLGVLEDEMSLFEDADASLRAAEELLPHDLRLLYAVARVKLDLGQFEPAEKNMTTYLRSRPNDASAHYGLGRVYQLGLRFDQAKVEFRRSILLRPLQTEAYYQLGDMALQQGEMRDAIDDFGRTLSRNPKHGGALTGMGEAYFKQKNYLRAIEFLKRAVAASPDYQPGHYFLGLTLARLGETEESQHELDTAGRLADVENAKRSHERHLNDSAPR